MQPAVRVLDQHLTAPTESRSFLSHTNGERTILEVPGTRRSLAAPQPPLPLTPFVISRNHTMSRQETYKIWKGGNKNAVGLVIFSIFPKESPQRVCSTIFAITV